MPIPARPLAVCGAVPQNNWEARSQSRAPDAVTLALTIFLPSSRLLLFFIINVICQHKHKTDCNTTEYSMVKYAEQDREAQKCSYLGPIQNKN